MDPMIMINKNKMNQKESKNKFLMDQIVKTTKNQMGQMMKNKIKMIQMIKMNKYKIDLILKIHKNQKI